MRRRLTPSSFFSRIRAGASRNVSGRIRTFFCAPRLCGPLTKLFLAACLMPVSFFYYSGKQVWLCAFRHRRDFFRLMLVYRDGFIWRMETHHTRSAKIILPLYRFALDLREYGGVLPLLASRAVSSAPEENGVSTSSSGDPDADIATEIHQAPEEKECAENIALCVHPNPETDLERIRFAILSHFKAGTVLSLRKERVFSLSSGAGIRRSSPHDHFVTAREEPEVALSPAVVLTDESAQVAPEPFVMEQEEEELPDIRTGGPYLPPPWRRKSADGPGAALEKHLLGPIQALVPVREESKASLYRGSNEIIDIIIPVYNGLEHLERLLPALFAHTSGLHRFVFIDDCSPDPEVFPWLEKQLTARTDCLLLRNSVNLGFPATVNRGASLSSSHFVILNTDTEVPSGWLKRLVAPLFQDHRIASATPFSNAATIFSFPVVVDDETNALFLRMLGLPSMDKAFSGLAPDPDVLAAPTGVGFCMAISRQAWNNATGFNVELFGKGYGEEVDWCRRTLLLGWKHVLVPDVYVSHLHGGSFDPELRRQRRQDSATTLERLYPDYNDAVAEHVRRDPWLACRATALFRLFLEPDRHPVLYLGHALGGGAEWAMLREIMERGHDVSSFVLVYEPDNESFRLSLFFAGHEFSFPVFALEILLSGQMCFETVIVNNIVGWPDRYEGRDILDVIRDLAAAVHAPLEYLFHDFYALCPRFVLVSEDGNACGLPKDMDACSCCANRDRDAQPIDMAVWRQRWQRFLVACAQLIFFSESTLREVEKAYTLDPQRCRIRPHEPLHRFVTPYVSPPDAPLTIAVVGNIQVHKGSRIVEALARLLASSRPEARIVVIGDYDAALLPNILVTGKYNATYLREILHYYRITCALFPSVWPETFSYVVQELMQLQIPLVCFDLGAPAERVRQYPYGLIASEISAEAALQALEQLCVGTPTLE